MTLQAGGVRLAGYDHIVNYSGGSHQDGLQQKDLLLEQRMLFLVGPVDDRLVTDLAVRLFYLESRGPDEDIYLYINSPGGSIHAGLALYDVMEYISCDVVTICFGLAASMASFLLASGTAGKRMAMPSSKIMIHQPLQQLQGTVQATDMMIYANEIMKTKAWLNQKMAERTGQTLETISRDTERDYWMSAQEAVDYGIIDRIAQRRRT